MVKKRKALAVLLALAMVMTSFSVPVMAENVVTDDVEAVAEVVEETEVVEDVVGTIGSTADKDQYYEVRSFKELCELIPAVPSDVPVYIWAASEYSGDEDYDYCISGNSILEIPAGKDITLDIKSCNWYFSDDDIAAKKNKATLKIANGAKLVINSGMNDIIFNIENEGNLVISASADIEPSTGVTITNKGDATIEGVDIYSADYKKGAIVNEGTLKLNACEVYGKSGDGSETAEDLSYTITNSGTIFFESVYVGSASGMGTEYAVKNTADGKIAVRGDTEISSIYNEGMLTVGEENDSSTNVYTVVTVNGGKTIQHAGTISTLAMANDINFNKLIPSGSFTQVGGEVDSLYFNEELPTLEVGTVYSLVKMKSNGTGIESDKVTTYKFKAYNEEKKLETVNAFRLFNESEDYIGDAITVDGKQYIVADEIINGIPFYDGKPFYYTVSANRVDAKPIMTVEDFIKAAKAEAGGVYFIGDPALEIDKKITFTTPYFVLVNEGELADGTYVNMPTLYLKDEGCLEVAENSSVDIDMKLYKDCAGTVSSNAVITNNGNLRFRNDIKVDAPGAAVLVNNGQFKVTTYNWGYETVGAIRTTENSKAVVVNGEKGIIDYMKIYAEDSKAVVIENSGEMYLGRVEHEAYYDSSEHEYLKGIGTIVNKGSIYTSEAISSDFDEAVLVDNKENANVEVNEDMYTEGSGCTVIKNAGNVVVCYKTISTKAEKSTVINCTAGGKLVMYGGTVKAYSNGSDEDRKESKAIVYADNEPIIMYGSVEGSRNTSYPVIDDKSPVPGSAIIKADNTTGFFKNSENTASISSKNAGVIKGGKIPYDITMELDPDYKYLLMETGESVLTRYNNDLGEYNYVFDLKVTGNTFGVPYSKLFEVKSLDDNVAKVSTVKASVYDKDNYEGTGLADTEVEVFTAVNPGTTNIQVSLTELIADYSPMKDYIRVEVVGKGQREKIIGSNYTARLEQPVTAINAYQKSFDLRFAWHLTDSSNVGAYSLANNFYPDRVKVTGKTKEVDDALTKYFDIYDEELKFDAESKAYYMTVDVEDVDSDGETTYLAQDEVTKLENLNVTLICYNKVSKKTLEIPVKDTLSILVNQTKPVAKFGGAVVNSAYTEDADCAGFALSDIVKQDCGFGTPVVRDYLNSNTSFEVGYGRVIYNGPAKGGSFKVPVSYSFDDYYGRYDTVIPVVAKPVYPKLTLDTKAVTVPENAGDYYNIPLKFLEKNSYLGVQHISSVTVVGNNDFAVEEHFDGDNGYNDDGNGLYTSYDFNLVPRCNLKKAQKVTLKVSYANLKLRKGKPYVQTVSLAVKPVNESKFKMNKPVATTMYVVQSGEKMVSSEGAVVGLSGNPSNYTDGYYVVEPMDDKTIILDDPYEPYVGDYAFNGIVEDGEFFVYPSDKLTANDKLVTVKASWYSAKGMQLGKSQIVKIPVNSGTPAVTASKVITVDVSKTTVLWDIVYPAVGFVKYKAVNGAHFDNMYGSCPYFDAYVYKDGTLAIVPTLSAFVRGYIVPGNEYKYTMVFMGSNGEKIELPLTVKVAPVKKVKLETLDGYVPAMSGVTADSRSIIVVNQALPYSTLEVESVTLDAKSAAMFDIASITDVTGYWREVNGETLVDTNNVYNPGFNSWEAFELTYKDHKLPTGLKSKMKVTLNIKYTCGATGKISVPIEVVGIKKN